MARRKKGEFVVGDRVRVMFGRREHIATVTEVSGNNVHISFYIEGVDDPIGSLYRADELVRA
ncbi:hypothetical protein [[Mycobacterium] vasticus]|uniref:KOW domain-containing protein n=1 Tax=[Mycobacterium] vasticus TaxID=2875777 RepID=A0ABU5YXY7_9MYCO|nr:hypothetical protein [Mycolicibacter sp. MYC017]MEB3068839.1 hypothetical protein [Mycolicibacter sp. MYC017]